MISSEELSIRYYYFLNIQYAGTHKWKDVHDKLDSIVLRINTIKAGDYLDNAELINEKCRARRQGPKKV